MSQFRRGLINQVQYRMQLFYDDTVDRCQRRISDKRFVAIRDGVEYDSDCAAIDTDGILWRMDNINPALITQVGNKRWQGFARGGGLYTIDIDGYVYYEFAQTPLFDVPVSYMEAIAHTCYVFIDKNGRIYEAHFDISTSNSYTTPVCLNDNPIWVKVSGGMYSLNSGNQKTCIFSIDRDGYLWVSGNNDDCQLGIGESSAIPFDEPVKINDKKWKDVYSRGYATAAIDSDGLLWRWGRYGSSERYTVPYCDSDIRFSSIKYVDNYNSSNTQDIRYIGEDGKGYTYNYAAQIIRNLGAVDLPFGTVYIHR